MVVIGMYGMACIGMYWNGMLQYMYGMYWDMIDMYGMVFYIGMI